MKDSMKIFDEVTSENEKEFVTEFEKDCISRISELCAKRKKFVKLRRILLAVSGAFCMLSALFLVLSVVIKKREGTGDKLLLFLSVLSSTVCIISGWHSEKVSENEISVSKDIAFFEDAIMEAEEISD